MEGSLIATPTLSADEGACEIHRAHAPKPLLLEKHHYVPQAWQAIWSPSGRTPQRDSRGDVYAALWVPETVVLGPTCHRNVHHWIVAMMKGLATQTNPEDWWAAYTTIVTRKPTHEQRVAREALARWDAHGGAFQDLIDAKQWGYA